MSETTQTLRRKISSANDLKSVVLTMKAMAASSIGQYERSVAALADYNRSVELGLGVCLRRISPAELVQEMPGAKQSGVVGAVVFGSDQGLVGRFNDEVADYALESLSGLPEPSRIWAVGERVSSRLDEAGLRVSSLFSVPNSVRAIAPLLGEIILDSQRCFGRGDISELRLFHNSPTSGSLYSPTQQRLLPLDQRWSARMTAIPWPTRQIPEDVGNSSFPGDDRATLGTLIREYLFVSLFRACAESLASENAARLAAMQRAEKNISDLLDVLNSDFHRLRQSRIDEELFDVISGFEALVEPESYLQ